MVENLISPVLNNGCFHFEEVSQLHQRLQHVSDPKFHCVLGDAVYSGRILGKCKLVVHVFVNRNV